MRSGCMMAAAALLVAVTPADGQSVKAGIEAWQRGDYPGAITAWRPLAAKGNVDAMFNVGQAYRLGRGVPVDLAQAQDWYDRAAHGGHVDAQVQLGMLLFQNGNRAGGLRWLKAAADKGEPRAQLLYGTALFNGDGIVRDPMTAYAYVAKSAAQGLAPASATLAQLDATMPAEMKRKALAMGTNLPSSSTKTAPRSVPTKIVAASKVGVARTVPAALPPTVAMPTSGNWRVQLGAFSQRSGAESLFRKLAAGPLAGRSPYLVPAGAMTRLQAGPFASRGAAAAACTALAARGQACFVVAVK